MSKFSTVLSVSSVGEDPSMAQSEFNKVSSCNLAACINSNILSRCSWLVLAESVKSWVLSMIVSKASLNPSCKKN